MKDVLEELAYHFRNLFGVLKNELFDSWFGLLFMMSGLIVQYIAYKTTDAAFISLVSGSAGVISVVLCSQKKWLFYAFGWLQLITYCILAYEQRLYGEIIENCFYGVMMVIGMWTWLSHYNRETAEVETRRLSKPDLTKTVGFMIIAIVILNAALSMTDDTQPLLDSATTVPAFIGQILLTYRYREQWLFWFIIDVGSIIMWLIAGDYCMAAQFVFWTFNCIYGFYKWSK